MKKSLILWLFVSALGVCSLPGALLLADSGKERIQIREEVLSGDPAEAEGILLRLPSHWGRRLFWDTEYVIGSGAEAESSFAFSSRQVFWEGSGTKLLAGLAIQDRIGPLSFGPGITDLSGWEQGGAYAIIDSAAQRTEEGEVHTEIVRLGDYCPNYPLEFWNTADFSVKYEGDYLQACDYLGDFFHIQTGEDKAEITVQKNSLGEIGEVTLRQLDSNEELELVSAAADGGQGIYLVWGLRDGKTGEAVDRGQNRGIFYFPYEYDAEDKSFRRMDLTRVRKLQEFPDSVIPRELLMDQERKTLFLAVEDPQGFSLFVYRLEGEIPVPAGQIPVKTGKGALCRMEEKAGGILMTFEDNSFSFAVEEAGQYREWCRGVFPESPERDEYSENPFPEEQALAFDGEKLTLAAYEDWRSLNVLLAVYDGDGMTYSGRYVHSGNEDRDAEFDPAGRLLPQGYREGRPEDPWDAWKWGNWRNYADEVPEPLEILRRAGQMP